MKDKDSLVLESIYTQQINEAGMFDRLKARKDGIASRISTAPEELKGHAKKSLASAGKKGLDLLGKGLSKIGVNTDVKSSEAQKRLEAMEKEGESSVNTSQFAANKAQVDSIFDSHSSDINNLMNAISADFEKLGYNVKFNPKNAANLVIGILKRSLYKN